MGLPAFIEDYLFLGPLIAERLADQVPDVPAEVVETAEQVFAADRRTQVLMVMWAGDAPGDGAARTSTIIRQRWLVLVALGDVSLVKDARQLRAGPLMSQVHKALVGWVPRGAVKPLTRAAASVRPDIRKDKALYPLGFEIELSL